MGRKQSQKSSLASRIFAQTFYDPRRPGAYGGVEDLRLVTRLTRPQVKEWLSHQDTYTLHKPVRRHFGRRRIVVGGLDHQFQADLNLSTLFERRSCGILCVTHNEDIKASIMERFNRTLKERLWRYFTRNNTLMYVEALSKLVRAYNHSYHRSIKRAPADVSATNQEEVWQTLYGQPHDTLNKGHRRPKLKEGDGVRIRKARTTFKTDE